MRLGRDPFFACAIMVPTDSSPFVTIDQGQPPPSAH
jgi:hypothetical protein